MMLLEKRGFCTVAALKSLLFTTALNYRSSIDQQGGSVIRDSLYT